jgi:catechol 2,3-dioxygenase-like lactoylglutathione lyase family enzyme
MRLQLALNVTDLEASIDYYQRLFGVEVAKRKPGYANFEIEKPALKLVLFETDNAGDRLNHLGVETFDDADVIAAAEQQRAAGLEVDLQLQENCCFAQQNKAVSYAPDGTMWEWYHKLEDLEEFACNC